MVRDVAVAVAALFLVEHLAVPRPPALLHAALARRRQRVAVASATAGLLLYAGEPDGSVVVVMGGAGGEDGGAALPLRDTRAVAVISLSPRRQLRVLVRQLQPPRRAEPESDPAEERPERRQRARDDADAGLDDGPDDYAGCLACMEGNMAHQFLFYR